MEYYSVIKKNEISFPIWVTNSPPKKKGKRKYVVAGKWGGSEDHHVRQNKQTEKDKNHVLSFTCDI
jgi:hypothetical protein